MLVQNQSINQTKNASLNYSHALLNDLKALEFLLENNLFETGITRIGAEQEMCIVDAKTMQPLPLNKEILTKMKDCDWVTTELGKHNLETNLSPRELTKSNLKEMEQEGLDYLTKIRKEASNFGADIVLTGILPTLSRTYVKNKNITDKKRYHNLTGIYRKQLNGGSFKLHIEGIDELKIQHRSPLLPGCNTSFQIHLQVEPKDFVKFYNISQLLTAPLIALSANAPILFGKRLWHESRIALYRQSFDTNPDSEHLRERKNRVFFGNDWLRNSVLELFKEDISRFKVLLNPNIEEDSLEVINNGKTPKLKALQTFNSTVYRWNRPCYGISPNGQPHLRIENRVISAGPTILDQMANAAFWFGAMIGIANSYGDITNRISFATVKDNFGKASKYGIQSTLTWFDNKTVDVSKLILEELIPIAKKGLKSQNIDEADIERYLNVIEARAKNQVNGATWMLNSYGQLKENLNKLDVLTTLTAEMLQNQKTEKPIHTWIIPDHDKSKVKFNSKLKVEDIMQTNFLTIQKDTSVQLATQIMKWNNQSYILVEDSKQNLVGLFSAMNFNCMISKQEFEALTVESIMDKKPMIISPNMNAIRALIALEGYPIECLPVVHNGRLRGVISKREFPNML